jgi:hypothetical protein
MVAERDRRKAPGNRTRLTGCLVPSSPHWRSPCNRRPVVRRRSIVNRWTALPAACVLVLAAACATSGGAHSATPDGPLVTASRGFPAAGTAPTGMPTAITDRRLDAVTDRTILVGWSRSGELLFVVTFGSGSCPRLVDDAAVVGTDRVRIDLSPMAPPPGSPSSDCSSDLGPYTSVVKPPVGISSSRSITVTIDSQTFELQPATSS